MSADRVRPSKNLEHLLDTLKDKGVFATKQKGLMFAAALGYAIHRSRKDELKPTIEKGGEGIRREYFEKPRDWAFIDLLAVASAKNPEMLTAENAEDNVAAFEGYAEIGLEEIEKKLESNKSKTHLMVISDLIQEYRRSDTSREGKLQRLAGLL